MTTKMPAGEVWTSILCSYLGVSLVSGITAFLFLKSPCEHKLKRRMHLMSLINTTLLCAIYIWIILGIPWRIYLTFGYFICSIMFKQGTLSVYMLMKGFLRIQEFKLGKPLMKHFKKIFIVADLIIVLLFTSVWIVVLVTNSSLWSNLILLAQALFITVIGAQATYLQGRSDDELGYGFLNLAIESSRRVKSLVRQNDYKRSSIRRAHGHERHKSGQQPSRATTSTGKPSIVSLQSGGTGRSRAHGSHIVPTLESPALSRTPGVLSPATEQRKTDFKLDGTGSQFVITLAPSENRRTRSTCSTGCESEIPSRSTFSKPRKRSFQFDDSPTTTHLPVLLLVTPTCPSLRSGKRNDSKIEAMKDFNKPNQDRPRLKSSFILSPRGIRSPCNTHTHTQTEDDNRGYVCANEQANSGFMMGRYLDRIRRLRQLFAFVMGSSGFILTLMAITQLIWDLEDPIEFSERLKCSYYSGRVKFVSCALLAIPMLCNCLYLYHSQVRIKCLSSVCTNH